MKYELEPDNHNCPDEELMADLQAVANRLEALSLTKEMYDANGRFSSSTIQKRFGSWNNALAQCGIAVQKRVDIPEEELLADLQRVAKNLQNQTVSREQYRTHGQFADITLSRHFGNWAASLTKAGMKSTGWKPPATEEDLFENMAQVWEHVGYQPTQ